MRSTRRPETARSVLEHCATSVQSPHTNQPGAQKSVTLVSRLCDTQGQEGRSHPPGKLISRSPSEEALRDSAGKGLWNGHTGPSQSTSAHGRTKGTDSPEAGLQGQAGGLPVTLRNCIWEF